MYLPVKKQFAVIFLCSCVTTMSTAQTTRQHDSHAHGVAQLNIVQEGAELAIELISPAANIVGFEHAPSTDEQKAAVAKAEESLTDADTLFTLPEQANCRTEHVHVESELLEENHDEHADEEHHDDEHAHEEHHDDEHADEEHHDDEHALEEDHDEHEHQEEVHSEFHVEYELKCDDVENLTKIQVNIFEIFPATETLNVQLLTPNQQTALTLDKENVTIDL